MDPAADGALVLNPSEASFQKGNESNEGAGEKLNGVEHAATVP